MIVVSMRMPWAVFLDSLAHAADTVVSWYARKGSECECRMKDFELEFNADTIFVLGTVIVVSPILERVSHFKMSSASLNFNHV